MKQIHSPKIGTVVRHTGWRFEKDDNYPCEVYIVSGNYMVSQPVGFDRLSNFWYWRRVLSDGTLAEEEHGYGDFLESEFEYSMEIKAKVI